MIKVRGHKASFLFAYISIPFMEVKARERIAMNAKQLYLYARCMATKNRAKLCWAIGKKLFYMFSENRNRVTLNMSLACMKKADKLYDKAIEQAIIFRDAMIGKN